MDPTACYREMLASLQDKDFEAAREHARNLKRWLDRGGFCPQGQNTVDVYARLNEVLRNTAAVAQLDS
jgi:hypothetical protein